MKSTSDDATVVTHSSPVSAAGFTMIPNAVMLRSDMKPQAKLLYGYLKHLAWIKHDDAIEPLQETIAADLGISLDAVQSTLRELAKTPVYEGGGADVPPLVVSKRRGQGRTNRYIINDPDVPDSPLSRNRDQRLQEAGDLPFPPSTQESEVQDKDPLKTPVADMSLSASSEDEAVEPPTIGLIEGRNLPIDTLFDVCGWDPGNTRRIGQVTAALNGRCHKTTGKLLVQGITHLFWLEVCRFVETHPEHASRLDEIRDDGAAYAVALAKAIRKKADLYRQTLPAGAMLTPTALAAWWLDVEKQTATAGGASADDIARMDFRV